MDDLAIIVSGHKPCVRPASEIYTHVQVGAAQASQPVEGTVPDTGADSISDMNGTFCELTAHYWAWRNLHADRIGACHYRRFFCFDGEDRRIQMNDHMQIEVGRLSPETIARYHIDDEALIRSAAEACDALVPLAWDVKTALTPHGVCKTVWEHMAGYGLVSKREIDHLERIVAARWPKYASDLHGYLYGTTYLGYNCFIMTWELFDRLCTFEFDVLMDFVATYDGPELNDAQSRIGGYLGEVLFSAFIAHIEREGAVVHHAPLVFFFETDPVSPASDGASAGSNPGTAGSNRRAVAKGDGGPRPTLARRLLPMGTRRRAVAFGVVTAIRRLKATEIR